MTNNLTAVPDFLLDRIEEADAQWGSDRFRNITVYNKNVAQWEKKADPKKAWKMYIGKHKDWEETWPMTGTILLIRKSFYWFLDNVEWKKDMYKSNMLGIFDKWPVVLEWNRTVSEEETVLEQFWPLSVKEMRIFVQTEWWQFFDQMKTPMAWWDPYPTSHVSSHYHIFFQDKATKEIFEIDPKSSYGRFSDVQPWTIEHLKEKAKELSWKRNTDLSFFEVELSCVLDESFYRLNWDFIWYIQEDNIDSVNQVRGYVTEFNNSFVKLASDAQVVVPTAPAKIEAPKAPVAEAPAEVKPAKPKPKTVQPKAPSTKVEVKETATGKTSEDLPW